MEEATEFLACRYRPDTGTMVCRWLREVSEAEIRTGYAYLFAEAQQADCWRWLLDIRRRNNDDPEMAQWLLDEVTLTKRGHVGGSISMAYLLSPHHLAHADKQLSTLVEVAHSRQQAQVALFIEEGAANEWLAQQASS